jgi:hypothetical protein
MAPTKKQLKQKNKELKEHLRFFTRKEPYKPQDFIDWLSRQILAPHPLSTSTDTMLKWLEAMNTGASRTDLQRRLGEVMLLWREQGISNKIFTREAQNRRIADYGADKRGVKVTTTWQQYLIAKETGELKKQEEEKKKEEAERERRKRWEQEEEWYQRGLSLGLIGPLSRSHPDSSAYASTYATAGHGERLRVPRFFYAPGPVPDLFPGYDNPWKAAADRLKAAESADQQHD